MGAIKQFSPLNLRHHTKHLDQQVSGGNEKKNGISLLLPPVKTFMEVPAEVGFGMWPPETALFHNFHIYS